MAQTTEQISTERPHPDREPDLAVSWLAALNAHDVDALIACYTDDAIFTDMGTGQVAHGTAELRAASESLFATFSELRIERTSEVADGDRLAHEFVMSGVHTGSVPGLPATSKSFSLPGAIVADLRDGKLNRVNEYWNMADLMTQVGLLPSR